MKKLIFALIGSVLLLLPAGVALGYFNEGDLNIGIRAEVSKDSATWYNYSADDNPGNQTLTASPGDSLVFRGKSWNTGSTSAGNLVFSITGTNLQYLDISTSYYDADEDGHGNEYYGDPSSGQVSLDLLASGGSENDLSKYESGTFRATVKNDVPDQTLIEGTITLTQAVESLPVFRFIPQAYAQGEASSTVRIVVSNPPATTQLPATGASPFGQFLSNYFWLILLGGLALVGTGIAAIAYRRIRK